VGGPAGAHCGGGSPPPPAPPPPGTPPPDARDEFLPAAAAFVMHLPTLDEYVAVHDTTFHLHEHPERAR
jgi:hypothetical protein